jgi:hypothetical protein
MSKFQAIFTLCFAKTRAPTLGRRFMRSTWLYEAALR